MKIYAIAIKYEIAFDDIYKKLKDVETERDNLKKDIIL